MESTPVVCIPEPGNHLSFKEKIRINIMPNQNSGNEIPILVRNIIDLSYLVPFLYPAIIPSPTLTITEKIMEPAIIRSVAGNFSVICLLTERLL